MKRRMVSVLGLLALSSFLVVPAFSQKDSTLTSAAGDLYVISAKAGGINYVEGAVTVLRADGTSSRIVKGDDLDAGDLVETGAQARAEILLNPGSFARLDHNSKLELITTDLDDLRVKVLGGSAIFEVFASDDFKVSVITPKGEFFLVKSGVYRVDVLPDGVATLEVWRGKAEAADIDSTLSKGRTVTLNGPDAAVAKFDRGDKDSFDEWSKDRAELIVKANKKLQARQLRTSLLNTFRSDVWNCWDTVGLWVYSNRYGTYSFLPFGSRWRSPYGFNFGWSNEICYNPSYFYRRPYSGLVGGGGGYRPRETPSTETPQPTPSQRNIDRAARLRTPPFQRMQQTGSVETRRAPIGRTSPDDFPSFPSSGGSRSTGSSSAGSSQPAASSQKPDVPTRGRGN